MTDGQDDHDEREDAVDDPRHDPELEAMADAVEAERGEADASGAGLGEGLGFEAREPALPRALILPGLAIVAASAAPLHPDGYSFLQLLYVAFLRHPLEGIVMLLGFGAPFLFGLIVALAAAFADRGHGARAMLRRFSVANLSLLHAQLLLVSFILAREGVAVMAFALVGFALVSGSYFIIQHAAAAAMGGRVDDQGEIDHADSGPKLHFLFRWGATMVVAICGWVRLQLLIDVRLGWAVEVLLASCMLITILLVRSSKARPE